MNSEELATLLRTAFGERASVRALRPNRLYQITLPVYLADGDAAFIFVEPTDDGRLVMSDMGQTSMRLSYTRASSDSSARALERLAERHGFSLQDGTIRTHVRNNEIVAGALGLLQIEAEAEATITAAIARGRQA